MAFWRDVGTPRPNISIFQYSLPLFLPVTGHLSLAAIILLVTRHNQLTCSYTQPVGLGRPAILQAPFPGPEGNNS